MALLAGAVAIRQGRRRTSLAPLLAAGAVAAPLQAPRGAATATACALTPSLASFVGVNGEGCNDKAVVVFIAIVFGRGVKSSVNSLTAKSVLAGEKLVAS